MKFQRLIDRLDENQSYRLNQQGQQLVQKFHQLIKQIEDQLVSVLSPYVTDPTLLTKEIAVQIISSINSQKIGSEEFDIMSRLDTLTNGGKSVIDGATFTFNPNDPILNYVELSD